MLGFWLIEGGGLGGVVCPRDFAVGCIGMRKEVIPFPCACKLEGDSKLGGGTKGLEAFP